MWRRVALGLAALCAAVWPSVLTPVAGAHPLDEYLQATYVVLASDRVSVELNLTPGVLVAPQVVALVDTDNDGQISDDEAQAYARRVLSEVQLEVDQHLYALSPTRVTAPPMLNLTAGVGVFHIEAATSLPLSAGPHRVTVVNAHAPVKSAYQSAVVLDRPGDVEVHQQTRDELQQSLRVDYSVLVASPSANVTNASLPAGVADQQQWLLDALAQPTQSPVLLALVVLLAAALGGMHGLTPGHGKTLLAAYLVGNRGTVRHAVFLGGSLTFAHTASVLATGVLVLLAGQLIVPQLLVPALEFTSGLLVVALGVRLLLARWRSFRHGHSHADHHHEHDEHAYPHSVQTLRWRDLAVMGVSGGLVPCPEAIGILLVAVGLNRVALGLGLITAFSIGLAVVLCLLGVLLVRARGLADHVGSLGARAQRFLPLSSALVVTLLGTGILLKGVVAYLP